MQAPKNKRRPCPDRVHKKLKKLWPSRERVALRPYVKDARGAGPLLDLVGVHKFFKKK
jgi:hypothetical protein